MVCNGLNIVKEPIQQEDRVAYLTSMQEAVICIGTKVEKVVPECEAFVGQLSSLAEYFYQLSLGEEMNVPVWDAAQVLCVDITEGLKHVLPERYEIVFCRTRYPCGIVWKVFTLRQSRIRNVMSGLYRFHIIM